MVNDKLTYLLFLTSYFRKGKRGKAGLRGTRGPRGEKVQVYWFSTSITLSIHLCMDQLQPKLF